jgi:hypothetical protein
MKSISNGSGEALYVDSSRPIDTLMTVINPTPLDAQLDATKTSLKTEMYELAGLQQLSFDMENFRSAAALVAMDQFHDSVFQAQMTGMADFVKGLFEMQVHYNAVLTGEQIWLDTDSLLKDCRVQLKPVVSATPLGTKSTSEAFIEPDYIQMGIARAVIDVLKDDLTYEDIPYWLNKMAIVTRCAETMVKINALGIQVPDSLEKFMVDAFCEQLSIGAIQL